MNPEMLRTTPGGLEEKTGGHLRQHIAQYEPARAPFLLGGTRGGAGKISEKVQEENRRKPSRGKPQKF